MKFCTSRPVAAVDRDAGVAHRGAMSVASGPMKAYRVVWLIVCAAFSVVGVSVAFYASPAALVALSLGSCVAAALWSLRVAQHRRRSRRSRSRTVLVAALGGGTAAGALMGYGVVWGVGVIPPAIALFAASPFAIRFWGRWLRTVGSTSNTRFDGATSALAYTGWGFVPVQRGDDLCLLTDEQLCEAWHASTAALRECSPHGLKRVAARRQRYLDEFERRNPKGLKVWLASSDTLSGDPRAFLVEGWADLPAVDWDELTGGQGA
jgi:hypothetical protein